VNAVGLAPQDAHKPWALRAVSAGLECFCFDHLRAAGVTPDQFAAPQHRRPLRDTPSVPMSALVEPAGEVAA
jgi:hypothetical protein